jgi:hypothetical protein
LAILIIGARVGRGREADRVIRDMEFNRRHFLKSSSRLIAMIAGPGKAFDLSLSSGQDPLLYGCPMHADVESPQLGLCRKCGMKLVRRTALPPAFTCPMHPEVQSVAAGACPKCRMALIRTGGVETGEYVVRIETSPASPSAAQETSFRFTVYHPVTGRQIRKFNHLHDKPFHLFIVSQDFESFEHLHPVLQPDGGLIIDTTLPKPGYYRIYCDFYPDGGLPQVAHLHLVTARFRGDLVSSLARLNPDRSPDPVNGRLTRTVDGTRFELTFEPTPIYAGAEFSLRYRLTDESTSRPVDDLRPYLAAWGHTLILSEDGTDYLHSHPNEMLPEGLSPDEQRRLVGRPEILFDTFFPRPGRYRIWSQFQRRERLITVPFTIDVPRLQ